MVSVSKTRHSLAKKFGQGKTVGTKFAVSFHLQQQVDRQMIAFISKSVLWWSELPSMHTWVAILCWLENRETNTSHLDTGITLLLRKTSRRLIETIETLGVFFSFFFSIVWLTVILKITGKTMWNNLHSSNLGTACKDPWEPFLLERTEAALGFWLAISEKLFFKAKAINSWQFLN